MNFKLTRKKLSWVILISIIGNVLSSHFVSSDIFYNTDIRKASADSLMALKPTIIPFLFLFFIVAFILWFVVIYVAWSIFEN